MSIAATGQTATALAAAGAVGDVTSGAAIAPERGAEPIAPSGQASRQLWQTTPRRARQPSAIRARGPQRSPAPPPSRARRESIGDAASHARHSAGAPGGPATS